MFRNLWLFPYSHVFFGLQTLGKTLSKSFFAKIKTLATLCMIFLADLIIVSLVLGGALILRIPSFSKNFIMLLKLRDVGWGYLLVKYVKEYVTLCLIIAR